MNLNLSSVHLESRHWQSIVESEPDLSEEELIAGIDTGELIVFNSARNDEKEEFQPMVLGGTSKKKVCALIGLGPKELDSDIILESIQVILMARPNCMIELSTNDNGHLVRAALKDTIDLPVGGCATYDIFRDFKEPMSKQDFMSRLEQSLASGLDFVLLHAGLNRDLLGLMAKSNRVMPTTSRGGGLVARYMRVHDLENPIVEYFDEVCELARKYRCVLDLGDIFRPGCLADAGDEMKLAEIDLQAELRRRALELGVSVLCESGGHMPLNKIGPLISEYKSRLGNAPLWLAGPMVIDTGVTLDATVNAIGVAEAAQSGGDLFASITDNEHYAMPTAPETAASCRQVRVALEAAEVAMEQPAAIDRNKAMSSARRLNAWVDQASHSIFPDLSNQVFLNEGLLRDGQPCTICGKFCPHIVITKTTERTIEVKAEFSESENVDL